MYMPCREQALQRRGHSLPKPLKQAAAADATVLVQIVQNFNLPFGRGPHGPRRVNTQEAKFFAGGVYAGSKHEGLPAAQGARQPFFFFSAGLADAGQGPGNSLSRLKTTQANARQP